MMRYILWITGLPGSGKTALSKKLHTNLKKKKIKTIVIDGDNFRKKIADRDYGDDSRERIGFLKIKEAIKYYDKGYFVIVSGVAYKKKWRKNLRKFCEKRPFKEIFLKCSIKKCVKRNIAQNKSRDLSNKNNYKYEEYKDYDLKINTSSMNLHEGYTRLNKFLKISNLNQSNTNLNNLKINFY